MKNANFIILQLFRPVQNYTFPSRHYAYVQRAPIDDRRGVFRDLVEEYNPQTAPVDDRRGVFRDLVEEYNLQRGGNRPFDMPRDINDDDDEIFV